MKKEYLLTPGPTPIPPEVGQAQAQPIIHHRTPQFQAIFHEVTEGLKYVFQTRNEVIIFASSGTGAMEAAVSNLISAGDRAIVVIGGKFGERWAQICQTYGAEVIPIDGQRGKAVEPERIKEVLETQDPIKAVFTTLCETSTGVTNDIEAIGKIIKNTESVLVVDAISGLAAIDLQTDNWNVDMAVAGSQKGLMLPPGLSFCAISPKAWRMMEGAKSPRYYFDFKKAKAASDKWDTPFTPAISLIIALNESLKLIKQVGLKNIFLKNKRLAEAVREAVKALGLELLSPLSSSDAVTAAKVPSGIDGLRLVKIMSDRFGVTIAGGQAELKGKIFRIAHMGYIKELDIIVAIVALEMSLKELGYRFELGAGIKAAESVLTKRE